MLTKKDAENWLTDELEGETTGTFDFKGVVELLHDYYIEATRAVAKEMERLYPNDVESAFNKSNSNMVRFCKFCDENEQDGHASWCPENKK